MIFEMKKVALILTLFLLMLPSTLVLGNEGGQQWIELPPLEFNAPDKIITETNPTPIAGTISYKYINGKTGSSDFDEVKGEDHDKTIEDNLKRMWAKEYAIEEITHIDGVPIEKTKFAKYAGQIRTCAPVEVDGEIQCGANGFPLSETNTTCYSPDPDSKPHPDCKSIVTEPVARYPGDGVKPNGNDPKVPTPKPKDDSIKVGDTTYKPFDVTVKVDNDDVVFPDATPYIAKPTDRTMVPMRAVFEHKNIQSIVEWDGKNQTVTAVNNQGHKVIFTIGKYEYLSISPDGSVKKLYSDAAPVVLKNRTYLPLRALGDGYGIDVKWIGDQKLVEMKLSAEYKKYLLEESEWTKKLKEPFL